MTTSSCAGRVSVFLEGRRATAADGEEEGDGETPGTDGTGGELPGHYIADLVDIDEENENEKVGGEGDVVAVDDGDGGQGQGRVDGSGSGIGRERNAVAGFGGKGGGGRWLFVSHEPLETDGKLDSEPNIVAALLGMEEPIFNGTDGGGVGVGEMCGRGMRLIHFKFEPMVCSFFLLLMWNLSLVDDC